MKRTLFSAVAALATAAASAHAAVVFQEIARFDVSASADAAGPSYIGNNPSAVAWNGRQLFIAGFNSSGGAANVGIAEVTNATATGVQTATLGNAFGTISTPNLRGYSGLDLSGTNLAAAYDNGGASASGIQLFSASTSTQTWAKNARGGSGVAFDPGFASADSGVAWTTFGSGRRALQNTATGADIYTTGNGFIFNDTSVDSGSFWRDIDFDPSTGDIYARRSNMIVRATRTGGNSVTGITTIVPFNSAANFVAGHNLSFLSDTVDGDLVIYNNRVNTLSQSFASSIQVVNTAGASAGATFSFLGAAPLDGVGYYDFDFDPLTQTLALADFQNRTVSIFAVVPEPASGLLGLVSLAALAANRRR